MTVVAASPDARIVDDRDPRDPEVRLDKLFDPATLAPIQPRDGSGVFTARGCINGARCRRVLH